MSNHSEHNCRVCGTDISGKRSDARYCSARCRMRDRRRQQKKTELIAQLVELFGQLPNHAAQYANDGIRLACWDATRGKIQTWGARELQSLSIRKLKAMISEKRKLLATEALIKKVGNLFHLPPTVGR